MAEERPHPFENMDERRPRQIERPGFHVDLRRCIGCHACSVGCKTAHQIPLGEFPLRVRWLPRPDGETYAFVPVFSESLCQEDPDSLAAGLDPVCVRACPTDALRFTDFSDHTDLSESASSPTSKADPEASADVKVQVKAERLTALRSAEAPDLKRDVLYRGLEDWMPAKINQGAALDPRDEDPIYEQD